MVTIRVTAQYWHQPADVNPFRGRLTIFLPTTPSGELIPELRGPEQVLGERLDAQWGYSIPRSEAEIIGPNWRHCSREVQGPSWEAVRVILRDLLAPQLETLRRTIARNHCILPPPDEEMMIVL